MQLAVYLAKEVAATLRAVLTHETKNTRSCSTHRPDTTRPGKGKESDPVVAWSVLQHTLDRPKSGSHQPLAPAFVTGLVVSATRIPCSRRRIAIENPSWMDQEEALADILKQWQEARANRRMQFKVGNYRDGGWVSHSYVNRHH